MMNFKERISQLFSLIQKEFKLFFRNKFFPKNACGLSYNGDFDNALGSKYGDKKCQRRRARL